MELAAATAASLGSDAPLCPSEATLQASTGGNKSALLTASDCATVTIIHLTANAEDGNSLVLNAQKMGIVHYIHATGFPATAVNLSDNPLQSVDLASTSANLTHIILSSCSLSSLAGVVKFPHSERTKKLRLDLSKNSLTSIEDAALPDDLTSLSLSTNAFTSLVNASLPDSLSQLFLANNTIAHIESTEFPSNLQLLDLQGNPLTSVEIREKDVSIFKTAVVSPVISQAKCVDSRATLQTINSHQICVISDALFEQKKSGTATASPSQELPETTVESPATSSSTDSSLSIVLGLLYTVIGLAAVIVVVFIARKMILKRRAQRESDQINQYLDARELTPPPEMFLSGTSSVTRNSALNSRTWRLNNKLPRLQSQSPRGFLRPLLRVFSGVKHEPSPLPQKPAAAAADQSAVEDCSAATVLSSTMCVALTLEDLTIPEESVNIGCLVSKGTFTYLYMAKIHESEEDKLAVAHQPRLRHNAHQIQLFMDTVNRNLSLKHPNIVSFVGFAHLNQVPTALVEHLPKGDLETLLQSARFQTRQSFQWLQRGGEGAFVPKSKAEIALDVIGALVYLHSLPTKVCFHNLRAKTVVLTQDFTAKLCAFRNDSDRVEAEAKAAAAAAALSNGSEGRFHSSSVSASSSPTAASTPGSTCSPSENSVAWMAPELLRGQQNACEKTDIYAFGVLLTELDTCELPYSLGIDDLDREQVALLVSSGCIRPSVATDCPVPIQELIQKCLSFSPEDRPHGVEIQYVLRKLVNKSTTTCPPKEGGESGDEEETVAGVQANTTESCEAA